MTAKVVVFEIPLINNPQTFPISLSGLSYQLLVYWCWPAQCWMLDIYDRSLNPILLGTPLVTGADLLAQYRYLGIPGELVVQTDSDTLELPTFTNLGAGSHLYFIPFDQGAS